MGVGPELGGREDLQLDVARRPAETAVGFAPEGVVEAGFGEGEQEREVVAGALAGGRGSAAAGHRGDDQRPEAGDQSHEGGDVSEQPQRESSGVSWGAVYGRWRAGRFGQRESPISEGPGD